MSAEHDELFQLILGRTTTNAVARILAAGWVKPRTITTVEELDALADGAVIMGDWATYQLVFGRWVTLGGPAMVAVELPVTVIHEGRRKAG